MSLLHTTWILSKVLPIAGSCFNQLYLNFCNTNAYVTFFASANKVYWHICKEDLKAKIFIESKFLKKTYVRWYMIYDKTIKPVTVILGFHYLSKNKSLTYPHVWK